jgi:hypothetical protein
VKADEREVGLGHGEVLVVSGVGDDRLALLGGRSPHPAGKVEPVHRGEIADRDRLSHLQVEPVRGVELRRVGILRPRPVQRVEVEARRAGLEEIAGGDVLAERDVGLVEGEVVVEELAQVGEAGGNI